MVSEGPFAGSRMVSGSVMSTRCAAAVISMALAAVLAVGGCPRRKPPPEPVAPLGSVLLPDLVAEGVLGLPTPDDDGFVEISGGGELILGASLRNDGVDTSPDPSRPMVVQLVLSPSRLLEPGAIELRRWTISQTVQSGERVTLGPDPIAIDAPPGEWTLILVVDAEDEIEEAYATNNILRGGQLLILESDTDEDGMSDSEELALARAFAPTLLLHPDEECPERHPAWAVRPIFGGASIFYAINWERDCGLPLGGGAAAHLGDAEFVVVELLQDAQTGWEIRRIFLSAHYRSGEGRTRAGELVLDRSGWWPTDPFINAGLGEEVLGGWHPQIVVAQHKHASYPSLDACRLTYDSCDEGLAVALQIRAGRNLGSRHRPVLGEIELNGATEWFWRGPLPFCGWQVGSVVLSDRSACAGLRNSWFEQLTAWQEDRLE